MSPYIIGPNGKKKALPEYVAWQRMKARCFDRNRESYYRYGGRGITVCERWLNSFANFVADMGVKPSPKHTLERIDNDGNYEPSNCRWATHKEQCRNRVSSRLITIGDETMCLAAWSERAAVKDGTIDSRLKYGWPPEIAIFAPAGTKYLPPRGGRRVST